MSYTPALDTVIAGAIHSRDEFPVRLIRRPGSSLLGHLFKDGGGGETFHTSSLYIVRYTRTIKPSDRGGGGERPLEVSPCFSR